MATFCLFLFLLLALQTVHTQSADGEGSVQAFKKVGEAAAEESSEDATAAPSAINTSKTAPSDASKGKAVLKRVIWTKASEPPGVASAVANGKTKARVAFRDVVAEKTGQIVFENFMERLRHPPPDWVFTDGSPDEILSDPMFLRQGMNMKKKTSLLDITMAADHMKIHGFHQLKLNYIRVIRHFGLRDIKVNLRVGADMKIVGQYNIEGQALGFLPVTGKGTFDIDIKGLSLSAISFLALNSDEEKKKDDKKKEGEEEDSLVMKELEVTVDYKEVHFEFQNLMGGGVVGSAANLVINAMGEAIVDSQKQQIVTMMKSRFKEEVSRVF